jgi:hypothetical protein
MKIKVGQILGAFQSGALSRLANASLPMRTALRLKEVLKTGQDALQEYDKERIALCETYAPINPETNNYDIPEDRRAEFQVEADALLQKEIDFPNPFTPAQLLSSQSITANDLLILDWLIVSEPEQSERKGKLARAA